MLSNIIKVSQPERAANDVYVTINYYNIAHCMPVLLLYHSIHVIYRITIFKFIFSLIIVNNYSVLQSSPTQPGTQSGPVHLINYVFLTKIFF